MIKMIAAVAHGGVIGADKSIPWDLPEDRRLFKELTMGSTLIVGRRTYESIGRALPGRDMIVVTSHTPDTPGESVRSAPGIAEAIELAGEKDIYLAGGSRIYEEGFSFAEVLYITRVELVVEGDTYFPDIPEKLFRLTDRVRLSANATLMTYTRK